MKQANEISEILTMASDTFPNLSEPLLTSQLQQHDDDDDDADADCESQSPTQSSTVASTSRVASSDEADAAGGIDSSSSSSQRRTKMNGFVLAVILFFNASGMSHVTECVSIYS